MWGSAREDAMIGNGEGSWLKHEFVRTLELHSYLTYKLTLARISFFTKRECPWGGGTPPPRHLAPECDKTSWQRPMDILWHSKSNGVRVDLFGSTVDLPGQVNVLFPGLVFHDSFSSITSFVFLLQGGSTHILCDPERSVGNFDLRSPKVKVTDWPK